MKTINAFLIFILKHARRIYIKFLPDHFLIFKRQGLLWLLNRKNRVDRKIAIIGYEHQQIDFLFNAMQKGCDYFIDIGANIGLYSLKVAQSGLAKNILSFEPDPRNHAQLLANCLINKYLSKIIVHNLALSDKKGNVDFTMYPEKSTGQSRIIDSSGIRINDDLSTTVCSVHTDSLDNLYEFKSRKLFFKIDVEGHEYNVIKGMKRTLSENNCFLQIESWAEGQDDFVEFMKQIGFKMIQKIDGDIYFSNYEV